MFHPELRFLQHKFCPYALRTNARKFDVFCELQKPLDNSVSAISVSSRGCEPVRVPNGGSRPKLVVAKSEGIELTHVWAHVRKYTCCRRDRNRPTDPLPLQARQPPALANSAEKQRRYNSTQRYCYVSPRSVCAV